jgi:hypothetical protein
MTVEEYVDNFVAGYLEHAAEALEKDKLSDPDVYKIMKKALIGDEAMAKIREKAATDAVFYGLVYPWWPV